MTALILALLLQHQILPAKAGYITYLYGMTNMRLGNFLVEGKPFQTFRHTRLEAILTDGTYLRMGESSEIVLESASLERIVVRLRKGAIVIDAAAVDKKRPITVFSDHLEFRIAKPGLYLFSESSANVFQGRLDVPAPIASIEKQWKLTWLDFALEKHPIEKWESHPLERWSRYRASLIAPKPRNPNVEWSARFRFP